jgi:hypothetical protein
MNQPTAPAQPVDLATESVAGEEDPGASVELASGTPEAAPTGTAELSNDFCRACAGTGLLNGGPCPDCEGSGRVGLEAAP